MRLPAQQGSPQRRKALHTRSKVGARASRVRHIGQCQGIVPSRVFTQEGLEVPSVWHSHIGAGTVGWWVDPKSKEMGDGGKNFVHNVAEAKKLIAAAGMTDKDITVAVNEQTTVVTTEGKKLELKQLKKGDGVGISHTKSVASKIVVNVRPGG